MRSLYTWLLDLAEQAERTAGQPEAEHVEVTIKVTKADGSTATLHVPTLLLNHAGHVLSHEQEQDRGRAFDACTPERAGARWFGLVLRGALPGPDDRDRDDLYTITVTEPPKERP